MFTENYYYIVNINYQYHLQATPVTFNLIARVEPHGNFPMAQGTFVQ